MNDFDTNHQTSIINMMLATAQWSMQWYRYTWIQPLNRSSMHADKLADALTHGNAYIWTNNTIHINTNTVQHTNTHINKHPKVLPKHMPNQHMVCHNVCALTANHTLLYKEVTWQTQTLMSSQAWRHSHCAVECSQDRKTTKAHELHARQEWNTHEHKTYLSCIYTHVLHAVPAIEHTKVHTSNNAFTW